MPGRAAGRHAPSPAPVSPPVRAGERWARGAVRVVRAGRAAWEMPAALGTVRYPPLVISGETDDGVGTVERSPVPGCVPCTGRSRSRRRDRPAPGRGCSAPRPGSRDRGTPGYPGCDRPGRGVIASLRCRDRPCRAAAGRLAARRPRSRKPMPSCTRRARARFRHVSSRQVASIHLNLYPRTFGPALQPTGVDTGRCNPHRPRFTRRRHGAVQGP